MEKDGVPKRVYLADRLKNISACSCWSQARLEQVFLNLMIQAELAAVEAADVAITRAPSSKQLRTDSGIRSDLAKA